MTIAETNWKIRRGNPTRNWILKVRVVVRIVIIDVDVVVVVVG